MKTKYLLFAFFLISINVYAQFDKVIFKKSVNIGYASPNVYRLGDINKDGYDDILIYDCAQKKAMIFLGGNPMDTIPKYTLSIPFSDTLLFKDVASLDINNDGINDIIITTYIHIGITGYYAPGNIMVFYGGTKINTIPDLTFSPPKGTFGFGQMKVLKDFNGDGKSELVIYDTNLPFSSQDKQFGINYFYNTGAVFDTIPHYSIQGDSIKGIQISAITSSGDINGDGKTDFTVLFTDTVGEYNRAYHNPREYRKFYLGNSNFDLTPSVTYYQDSVGFNLDLMTIIKDINGDGKDDFLMYAYDNVYPYYYGNSILWGSFPIDTVQDIGLNTQNTYIDFVTDAGDVNGDGFNDLFVRTNDGFDNHNAKIWLGGKHIPHKLDDISDKTWYGNDYDITQSNYGLCRQITAVGDVDGDKVNDICIQKVPFGCCDECTEGIIYIIKGDTSAKGDSITAISKGNNNVPANYVLEEPYPNPFNPSTIISWQMANPGTVVIKLFDITGKVIAEILNKEQYSGSHSIEFNAEKYKLSSGVYFIQMQVYSKGNMLFSKTKKLSLIK
jgi:hypothetical protein